MAKFDIPFENLQKPVKPKMKGVVDIIFLIDVSGSMAPAINELINNIDIFISNIDPKQIKDYRIKIGSFSDLEFDNDELKMNLNRPWRDNPKINQISEQLKEDLKDCVRLVETYYGGGDEPESSLDAVYQAIDLFEEDWSKRRRVIVLFTDATAKEIQDDTIKESGLSREDKLQLLIQKIIENHVDLFMYAPVFDDYVTISKVALNRVTYNAINEDGSKPVEALRNLEFSKVLETLGKSVSQPSVE